ncbi:MAG: aldehyde dehydrogenase (NADP(+)) [Terriglobales bacterium]
MSEPLVTHSLLGRGTSASGGVGNAFRARNPATGAALEPPFFTASTADLERAAALAAAAAPDYARRSGRDKAAFLRAIAAALEARKPEIVARAGLETALPAARLEGELARTANQLRLFASLVEEGSWVDARLDAPLADRPAGRKPAIRSMLRPLGPVAVFGASNFPLAFSVAGGDTASALAAGNPVIVKAHPAHPGTSALAAAAIRAAAELTSMPEGVFSLLFDDGIAIGAALVQHPAVCAVGFTGSLAAGRRLMDLAAARPQPIPVYAEMGSVNPVFILPEALATRGHEIAAGLMQSVTLGAGQFCTKPGLVLVADGADGEAFLRGLGERLGAAPEYTLLTAGISESFRRGAAARAAAAGVVTRVRPAREQLTRQPEDVIGHSGRPLPASDARPQPDQREGGSSKSWLCQAWLFETTAAHLEQHPELAEELFGPATLAVRHRDAGELLRLARGLAGHLTATVHGTEADLRAHTELLEVLAAKVGRLVINGYPTGVEVTSAMVHGGPYPAASLPQSSVGTRAIVRFTRPVCYQDMPEFALPPELQEHNPLGIFRLRDGVPGRD